MALMTSYATCGTMLKIQATGADAQQAAEALRELVEVQMFHETPAKQPPDEPKT